MRVAVFFILASTFNLAFACEEEQPCQLSAMEMFLPEAKRYPAPNIRIEKFIYQKSFGNVNEEISLDKLKELQEALSSISSSSFKESKTSFDVLAEIILTPSSIPELKLRTTGTEEEGNMLNTFYKAASTLTDYHTKIDKVSVFLQLRISAAQVN
ncbi:hypothetical protein L1285_13945 [Pseudoalteromonas sp. DL2-H2.2]|uniref:hypothetical protein n=1 Tax=Pseudoalteromonas sp. DL2-H2.2 TaxID=2908889 RepID=UPI001F44EC76|nr:hypothetical protein [Pseudoalteromonas sp. DL2-H2.2]MCF2909422.1 hypothetical protein [Pseudoalteromonas sp. DL2-H2.2]